PKLQMLMFAPNGGLVALIQPPAVQGVGSYGGFQFVLEDSGKNTISDLDRVAHQIVGASRARKDLSNMITTFSANDPQVLVTIDDSAGPPVINHYNLFRSVELDGSPAPGYSSGQAIEGMQQLAQQMIMPGMMYEWTGLTLDELESAGRALVIFGLGILVVYL